MRFKAALRLELVVALMAALALLLAGCGGDDDDEAGATTTGATAAEEATDPAELGDVTLVVWDQEVRGGQAEAIKKLNQQFQQKYPNITLKRTAKSFTDLQATLKLAASGPNPPDVVEVNNGYSAMGPLVTAGLLKPLDEYADRYGWADRYSEGLLKMNKFTEDGKTFGTGNLYGIPATGEVVGVYYNKAKLRKLGLELPKTFEEFEAALAKAKSGGEVPIQFGNLDKWTGIHEYEEIQLQQVDKDAARGFIFAEDSEGFDNEGNRAAADKLAEWTKMGYFTPGFAGLGYDPSWAAVRQGERRLPDHRQLADGRPEEGARQGRRLLPVARTRRGIAGDARRRGPAVGDRGEDRGQRGRSGGRLPRLRHERRVDAGDHRRRSAARD